MDTKYLFASTYTAQNGKTYSFGAETIVQTICEQVPAQVVADALHEYVCEAPHQGWEGFSRQDVSSIRKFLRDFALVVQDACNADAHVRAWHANRHTQPGEFA